jgi:hypothetical protein
MVTTCDEKSSLHEHEEGFQVVMIIKGEHYYLNLEMRIKKYPMNFGKNSSTHTFFFPYCLPNVFLFGLDVTTLALGLLSKQGHGRVRGESATRESHSHS